MLVGDHLGAETLAIRLVNAQTLGLDRAILCTPASSLEGVARQLQILGSDLDGSGCDPDNITINSMVLAQLWLAVYGVLNQILPLVPQVERDGYYSLADVDRCPEQGLGLFRRMLADMDEAPAPLSEDTPAAGDREILRLFALHRQHTAKVDAGELPEEQSDAEHKAGRTARRSAARTPASGFAGLLAKVDYILSEDANVDDDVDVALKGLRADLARMLAAEKRKPVVRTGKGGAK